MLPIFLRRNFDYLMKEAQLKGKNSKEVYAILEKLVAQDLLQRTRFEYSLQICQGQLKDGVRFVNFDSKYTPREMDSYRKRVGFLEDVALLYCNNSQKLTNLFRAIKKLSFIRLPLYIGFELHNDKQLLLKLYLNLSSIYRKNFTLAKQSVQYVLNVLNLRTKIEDRRIALFGLTLAKTGASVNHKIYYFFRNNFNVKKLNFSEKEVKFFSWLNQHNRLSYFDIMERYEKSELISRKIEVHPRNSRNFLRSLCSVSGNKKAFPLLKKVIEKTSGKIETVGIERNTLTIYLTMTNYGQRKILL